MGSSIKGRPKLDRRCFLDSLTSSDTRLRFPLDLEGTAIFRSPSLSRMGWVATISEAPARPRRETGAVLVRSAGLDAGLDALDIGFAEAGFAREAGLIVLDAGAASVVSAGAAPLTLWRHDFVLMMVAEWTVNKPDVEDYYQYGPRHN